MTTLANLKGLIIRLLGDEVLTDTSPIYSADYSSDLLIDAVGAALDAILPWVWQTKVIPIVCGVTSIAMPDDLVRIDAAWDSTEEAFIDPLVLAPGEVPTSTTGNFWLEYPRGSLTFTTAIGTEGGMFYYAASWAKPTADDGVLETPGYAITGIALYAASYCLLTRAVASGGIRQFNTKVDSGTPEDNPLQRLSEYFLRRFDVEMSRMPSLTKGVR